ncbi:hypothetical protein N9241_01630 [bacterium]|nr:hypothetical protein [bacterium]
MAKPISDEEFAEKQRFIQENLNLDQRCPNWLWEAKHFALLGPESLEQDIGRKLTENVNGAFELYIYQLLDIEAAFEEGLGQKGSTMAHMYQSESEEKLLASIRVQFDAIDLWKKKFDEGEKRGYAAARNSWLDYWDDDWAVRRENGKGWKVSSKDVLAALPDHIPAPDRSTITRQRQKRLKELSK